ncbi:MAG TPA: PqqD family peptide modification chaperone [Chloroflexota bacterium]|nr:PqqD family peptide modification chaperone [Chloroflexota bacterium]
MAAATESERPTDSADVFDVFYVRRGPCAPCVVRWRRGRPFTIGRLRENALALVDDERVSRRHAEVRYVDDAPLLYDPGSANGTLLNGRRVDGLTPLRPGDRIQVGHSEIVYNPPPTAPPAARLRLATSAGWEAPLPREGVVLLGNDQRAAIPLPHASVAPAHATIQALYGDYVLTDLAGDGRTQVNGQPVSGFVRLQAGDLLQLGAYAFVFECDAPAAADSGPETTRDPVAVLARTAPFDELPPPLVAALAARLVPIELAADSVLSTAVAEPALYVVVEGQVRIEGELGSEPPQPYTLATLGPGDFVGERALVEGTPYPRRLVAATPLRALQLTRAAYQQASEQEPRLRAFVEQRLLPFAVRRQLARTLLCRALPATVIDALAERLQPVAFAPQQPLARRGARCTHLLLVVSGWAQVLLPRGRREQVVGRLGAGEYLGDAIAAVDGAHAYTVVAETPVRAYALPQEDFQIVVHAHAASRALLEEGYDLVPPSVLLATVPPFNALPPQLVTQTAAQMRRKSFRAGEVIVEQDDPASAFYLVRTGTVQVSFRAASGEERPITTLGPGQHFGEAALLTGEVRNATVRAAADCQLWALYRDDFLQALRAGRAFELGRYFAENLTLRSRPRRRDGVEVAEQRDGAQVAYMLRSPDGASYLRLSERGMFIWELLDGDHTVNDLCVAYFARYNSFGVEEISATIAQLQALGFVEVPAPELGDLQPVARPTLLRRCVGPLVRLAHWRKVFPQTDAWFTALYRRGGWLFCTRPAQLALGALALAGLGAFGWLLLFALPSKEAFNAWALLSVVPGLVGLTVLHEFGHALATKHFGRRVTGAGIGLYYFFPYAFVGTSDIWMAGRWPRIVVSLAGPLVNLYTGALCALLAALIPQETARSVLFVLAALSFLLVLGNLHPFMELDGYYVLVDWLGVPNLRKRAMRFLREGLWRCLRQGRFTREERALALFGLLAALFTLGMGLSLTVFASGFYAAVIRALVPAAPADLLALVLSVLGLLVFLVPFAVELELITPQGLGEAPAREAAR